MRFPVLAATALPALLLASAGPAMAQVSAAEVWQSWKDSLSAGGEIAIGSETADGGTLTVTDVTLTSSDSGGTFEALIPVLTFTDTGEGSVSVTMAEEVPITLTFPAEGDSGPASFAATIRQTGLEMLVSGTAGAMTHDIAAARLAFEIDEATDASATLSGSVAFNDVSGSYAVTTGEMQVIEQALLAGLVEVAFSAEDPEAGVSMSLSGTVDGIESSGSAVLPLPESFNPETALRDGMAGEGGYVYGPTAVSFEILEGGVPVSGTLAAEGGALDLAASAESLIYSSQTIGLSVGATSAEAPFPFELSLAQSGIDLVIPLAATEDPADFAFGVNLTDLAVNDEIWAMLDPGALIPRDPATFVLDLTGTLRLFVDLADPDQVAAMAEAGPPGEIHSLSLNDLTLAVAGARVTGTGGFTFDNSDTTTIPGFPRPEGKIDLTASGVNGLIDTLSTMGLLPTDQVMGARMMLGLFTVPVGDDELTSTIEVNAEGHILANGQRLQ
jgi:hypothetical protein